VPNPISTIAEVLGDNSFIAGYPQLPYCFTDTVVTYGSPLVPMSGLDSVKCRFLQPRAKRFSSLGGGAAFLSNRNTGGLIELRFLQGSFSVAIVEMFNASGVPMPCVISDISTGGTASVIGTGCRVTDIGEFAREGEAPLVTIILEADRMVLFNGLRLPQITR